MELNIPLFVLERIKRKLDIERDESEEIDWGLNGAEASGFADGIEWTLNQLGLKLPD